MNIYNIWFFELFTNRYSCRLDRFLGFAKEKAFNDSESVQIWPNVEGLNSVSKST